MPIAKKTNPKTNVRLVLTEQMREAFEKLKSSRYSFMKEDEILKLAFSQLYALEFVPNAKHTSIEAILIKIRSNKKDFGKTWMEKRKIEEKDLSLDLFVEMVLNEVGEN